MPPPTAPLAAPDGGSDRSARRRRLLTLGRESAWLIAAQGLVALAGLIALRQLTALLPEAEYGQAYLLINGAGLVLSVVSATLSQAANRFFHDSRREGALDALLGFVWRAEVWLLLAAGAVYGPLAWWLGGFAGPDVVAYVVLPAYLALTSFQQITLGLLNTARRRGAYAALLVADAWLRPGLALLLGHLWRPDANAVLGGYAVASVVTGGASLALLWRMGSLAPARLPMPDRARVLELLRYAAPYVGLTACTWVMSLSDRYLVQWLLGGKDTGLYVAGYQVGNILPTMAGALFCQLCLPLVFQRASEGPAAAERSLSSWTRLFVWYTAAVGSLFWVVRGWLLRWLVAPAYWEAESVVGWVGLATFLLNAANVFGIAFLIAKRTDRMLATQVVSALVNVVANLVLIPRLGLQGAAISTLATYAVYLGAVVLLGRAHVPWRFPWGTLLLAVSGSAAAAWLAMWAHRTWGGGRFDVAALGVTLGVFGTVLAVSAGLLRAVLVRDVARAVAPGGGASE